MSETFPRQSARTRRFTLGAPRNFRLASDGSRVSFLRSTAGDDPVNRLWVLDLVTGIETMVANPAELLAEGADAELPPEEKARRERAREAGGGIVTYTTDSKVSGAVFALGGRLFTTDLETGETAGLPCTEGVFDPRPDPTGARVAYVAGGNLYVTSLDEGDRMLAGEENPDVTWGAAEFIAAEEMGRGRGYWWAPAGDRLLAARVDTTEVPRWYLSSPLHPGQDSRSIPYPAAGTINASIELAMVDLDGSRTPVEWNPNGEWEYLADASWAPDSVPLLVVQTRDQKTVAVVEVNTASGEVTERYRWTDPAWVELVPGVPRLHLGRLITVEDRGRARSLVVDGQVVSPPDLQIRRVLKVDDTHVLVAATTESTEVHVHRIATDGSGSEALTHSPGVHSFDMAGNITLASSSTMDHAGSVHRVLRDGQEIATIASLAETPVITPQVSFHTAGSAELRCAVVLPEGADRDTPLPVLIDPYGGPHALRVQKARNMFGTSQWFANQGFAVVICDGRGTPARGPEWERAVRGDLAAPVLDDQVAALEAMATEYPGMDLNRVGIRGWSFGGYLAALAVIRRPDRFHAGVAGAPVTDWKLYDTHYTERYLGHPDVEPENYERTDLTNEAKDLTRPLLLIHGLADDNVVAAHTLQLSQALLEAGRPHEVLPLSGVTHMTPQEVVAENLLLLQMDFLHRSLPEPS